MRTCLLLDAQEVHCLPSSSRAALRVSELGREGPETSCLASLVIGVGVDFICNPAALQPAASRRSPSPHAKHATWGGRCHGLMGCSRATRGRVTRLVRRHFRGAGKEEGFCDCTRGSVEDGGLDVPVPGPCPPQGLLSALALRIVSSHDLILPTS